MKILSIDTSSKICTVAILNNIELVKEITQDNGLKHSQILMPMIQEILEQTNLQLNDIDLIICDKGPGSFTGIRIGVATAKGFHDTLNINTIGISSLEALCYNCKNDGLICSLIDAKNSNAYYAIFEKKNNKVSIKTNILVENIGNILECLSIYNDNVTFVGDGADIYKNEIMQKLSNCYFEENNDLSAYNLGIAGYYHFKENKDDYILPLYIRKPQAELYLEEKLLNEKK